ncbi:MAG: hypothetical protein DMF93_18595 [Acidobacteria bacterium]|nr:MAG: hypothetical protein DMF93_18595 [Acidobacteriota bacterium]
MSKPDTPSAQGPWRSIIQSAVDAIVLIDAQGRIETFNPAAERLFGYSEGEVLGRNVSMLMPEPYRREHDAYIERYLSTGERRIHDLSARVRLEDRLRSSEARWRSIIESAVDGIVVIDAKGRIEAFNPAAERLFGYSEAEVIGQNVNMLMPSPYRQEHDAYLSRYLTTGEKRIIGVGREVTGLHRDGTRFPVHLSVGEMAVNGERKFTGILHDLSARIRMEEQIREQTALARLGEMAAVIAHEVKNPLAGIRGAIQVIGGRLPKESRDAAVAKEIVNRIDALNELMKDLLLFARPPQPRLAPVDLADLVRTTADLLGGDPALKAVAVQVDGDMPLVMADADLLNIVFGPGIGPDVLDKIFTPFFTTKARGTGLGLPTAKRIIEAHGGRIAVACPPGGGTTVTVELPSAQAAI